jgi:hypothetical protein
MKAYSKRHILFLTKSNDNIRILSMIAEVTYFVIECTEDCMAFRSRTLSRSDFVVFSII